MFVGLFVCECVCMFVCVCVLVCVCAYVYRYVGMRKHIHKTKMLMQYLKCIFFLNFNLPVLSTNNYWNVIWVVMFNVYSYYSWIITTRCLITWDEALLNALLQELFACYHYSKCKQHVLCYKSLFSLGFLFVTAIVRCLICMFNVVIDVVVLWRKINIYLSIYLAPRQS